MTGTRPRTTTRRDLLRLAAALVALTVLTATFALVAFARAQGTAETVRADTAPAVIEVALARAALVEADHAAMTSFSTGAVRLSGPGDDYRDQIAIAAQHLTRAAAHEAGADDGTGQRTLDLVNTLLAAYSSSIEQAAASFQHSEGTPLWASDLWTASRLLHAARDGALAKLDELRDMQIEKLDAEVASASNPVIPLSWLLPAIALLVLLGIAQVYLTRRFHRTINVGLAAACLCVVGMLAVTALTFVVGARLGTTRDTVHELRNTWDQQVSARATQGQLILADLIRMHCVVEEGGCGSTVQRVVAHFPSAEQGDQPNDDASQSGLTGGSTRIGDAAAEASEYGGALLLIPLAAVAALAAIGTGMYMRIEEYRYQAR